MNVSIQVHEYAHKVQLLNFTHSIFFTVEMVKYQKPWYASMNWPLFYYTCTLAVIFSTFYFCILFKIRLHPLFITDMQLWLRPFGSLLSIGQPITITVDLPSFLGRLSVLKTKMFFTWTQDESVVIDHNFESLCSFADLSVLGTPSCDIVWQFVTVGKSS